MGRSWDQGLPMAAVRPEGRADRAPGAVTARVRRGGVL